jgi:hypothetical protein
MGSLVLLLVIIARQAQVQAARAAAEGQSEIRTELEDELELTALMRSQLVEARKRTEADLEEARLELGHIEDHKRQLQDQLQRLQAAAADFKSFRSDRARRQEELAAELAAVHAAIAETKTRVAEWHASAAKRRKSYAIMPYRGPHETYRRPIYIECRSDAVIIQPEGVALEAEDFDGPLGPGNPLEVSLRAVREYLLERQRLDPDAGEPYPLLLVRPGGIVAYYAARAAMQSWGSQFGYELVDEDWELDFPEPDVRLAEVVRKAVGAARVRQRLLAAAAPSQYGSGRSQRPKYRAAPYRGGAVPVPGSGRVDHNNTTSNLERPGGEGFSSPPPSGPTDTGWQPEESPGLHGPAHADGLASGQPPRTAQRRSGEGELPLRPGEFVPSPPNEDRDLTGSAGHEKHSPSLATKRGHNWGLPNAAWGSVPITRPIRIVCRSNRLEIQPEAGSMGGASIEMGAETEDAIDAFVSAVWERIESWGIAGKGMYWQPLLNVQVAPGAEGRFAELNALLENSGLEIARKPDSAKVNR